MKIRGSGHDGRYVLIDKVSGAAVQHGDVLLSFRGDRSVILDGSAPHKPGSAGRVTVSLKDGGSMEYYPSVYGLEWVKTVF